MVESVNQTNADVKGFVRRSGALLKMGGGDGAFFKFESVTADDAIGDLGDHFFKEKAEVAAGAIVGGGDVFDAVCEGGKLVALFEGSAAGLVGIVDGDAMAAVFFHEGEAGHVGGAVSDIDHVLEGNGAEFRGHVIVDVFVRFEHAFVDAEEELGLRGVADDALGEADAAVAVFTEFAAEDFFDVGGEFGTVEEGFQA